MPNARAIAVFVIALSLMSAPTHAGSVGFLRSCWRALGGGAAQIATPPELPTPSTPSALPLGHGPYRQSAQPQAEVRVAHGAVGYVRFQRDDTFPALGEAWRALDGEEEDQAPIWGDVATSPNGSVRYMKYAEAMEYCIDLNPEAERAAIRERIEAGQAPERGIYLPLHSDFARLRRQLGSTVKASAVDAPGHVFHVLPNLNHWFRSSSVHPYDSNYAYYFDGRTGHSCYDYYRAYAVGNAVRCVARRQQ